MYGEPSVKDFFLFDSYQGLPELNGKDKGSLQFKKGDFSYSKQMVKEKLKTYGVYDEKHIHFIEGYFEDSLKDFSLENYGCKSIAILHIDVDLYESCKVVLEKVTKYLQTGTIILFDDWNCFSASNAKGERAAIKEWLGKNSHIRLEDYVSYGWHGKGFIVDM